MNGITGALLLCFLSQSVARAVAPETPSTDQTTTLSRAITLEAGRLAASMPAGGVQTGQSPKPTDTRHWCVRHGAGCGTLIGFTVGFLTGLMKPADDFEPMALGLIITGPIGAGIGAAVGWGIAEGTKPVQRQGP